MNGVPNEIRTRVSTVKGWCPGPLDDGDRKRNSRFPLSIQLLLGRSEPGWIRTIDPYIKSVLLYQLSYEPLAFANENFEGDLCIKTPMTRQRQISRPRKIKSPANKKSAHAQ